MTTDADASPSFETDVKPLFQSAIVSRWRSPSTSDRTRTSATMRT